MALRRHNLDKKPTRGEAQRNAIQGEFDIVAEGLDTNGKPPINYRPARADTNPEGYARTKTQINDDSLWPQAKDALLIWDAAAAQVSLKKAGEAGLKKLIERKAAGRKPNAPGSQVLKRDFGRSGQGRARHMARKAAAKIDAQEGLKSTAVRLKL